MTTAIQQAASAQKLAVSQKTLATPGQYLTFLLKGKTYAIGILNIKEIIAYDRLTEVPMMPPFIRGVINLRGRVVPVVDLLSRFGQGSTALAKRTTIIIVETLDQSEVGRMGSGRLILTGGASQLVGLAEMAANQLGTAARVGRPHPWGGVPNSVCTPGFASALGLAAAATMPGAGIGAYRERTSLDPTYLDRVGNWLQRSF